MHGRPSAPRPVIEEVGRLVDPHPVETLDGFSRLLGEGGVGHHHPGVGVLQEVPEVRRLVERVDRDRHRPEADRPRGSVAGKAGVSSRSSRIRSSRRTPASWRAAAARQARPQQLAVGHPLVAADDGRAVAPTLVHLVVEEQTDVAPPGVAHRPSVCSTSAVDGCSGVRTGRVGPLLQPVSRTIRRRPPGGARRRR